jgi:hypothetical protein
MNPKRAVLYLILFCSFFLAGFCSIRGLYAYASGHRLLKPSTQSHSQTVFSKTVQTDSPGETKVEATQSESGDQAQLQAASTSSVTGNGQQNILIVGVDDLSFEKPALENVWLVLYLQNSPQITLLPIYPDNSTRQATVENEILNELFRLDQERQPSPAFLSSLKARNLWWNSTLVMDREAMASIVEFVGGDALSGHSSGSEAMKDIPHSAVDPEAAFLEQFRLAQEICRGTKKMSPDRNISSLFALIPDHIAADLDLEQAKSAWFRFFEHGSGFNCEFPTLSIINSSSQ